jgi:hypothetical protein
MQNFYAKGAANAGKAGFERRQMIDAMAQDLARVWVPYEDSFSGTFRLSGQDFNWRTRPVDVEDRLSPLLDELESFLKVSDCLDTGKGGCSAEDLKKAAGPPSPALISLLRVYRVDVTKKDELREFLTVQRQLLTQLNPQHATPNVKK